MPSTKEVIKLKKQELFKHIQVWVAFIYFQIPDILVGNQNKDPILVNSLWDKNTFFTFFIHFLRSLVKINASFTLDP